MNTGYRLLKLIMPTWPVMVLAVLFGVLTVGAGVGLMTTSAFLIASAALHPPVSALAVAVVGVRFFGLSRAVFRYAERYISHDVTFRLLSRIRIWFYAAVEPLAPAGLQGIGSGDLFSRITGDVDTLQYFYLRAVAPVVIAGLVLAGMCILLSGFNPLLIYVIAGAFLCLGALLPIIMNKAGSRISRSLPNARGQLETVVMDYIQGLNELVASSRAALQTEKIVLANNQLNKLQKKAAGIAALSDALSNLLMNLAVWFTLLLTIPLVHKGQLDGVYLAVVVLAVQSCFEAALPLPLAVFYVGESIAAAGRLFAIADTRPAVIDKAKPAPVAAIPSIEIKGLSFGYGEAATVLDNISLLLTPGKRMAIVGPSGAGKSTIAALLLRFWDYETGSICLDGKEIKEFPPDMVRQLFGIVNQQAYLFNATIRDNILMARPDAGDAELKRAVRTAGLDELLKKLPDGWDTFVGQHGHSLSGGERQRIAIARAVLKNAPVLIMDEPTRGLDPVTEHEVMASVQSLMSEKSIILITHRLTGLEHMDEILVLERGRIIERGRQKELLNRRGLFYRMWQLQQDVLYQSS